MNKVFIIGRLGNDPEHRQVQGGTLTNFSVATSEKFSTREGKPVERTEWHRIVAFGKLAEICAQYLHKGAQVAVEGKLQTRSWEDQNGQKKYSTEIAAHKVEFLETRKDGDKGAPAANDDDEIPF